MEIQSESANVDAPKKRNRFMRKDYSRVVTGNLEEKLQNLRKGSPERLKLIESIK